MRNLSIKKHYFLADKGDNVEGREIPVPSQEADVNLGFMELCAVKGFEDLAMENAVVSAGDHCTYNVDSVSIRAKSQFYPVNSRTPGRSRFQKVVE